MSGNYEKPATLDNQNQEKLDKASYSNEDFGNFFLQGFEKNDVLIRDIAEKQNAMLNELQSIQGKLKTLEELTHAQKGASQAFHNKFVLRHVFNFSDLSDQYTESSHEEHFDASWCISVYKNEGFLAVYLSCKETKNKADWSIELSEKVRLISSKGSVSKSLVPCRFTKDGFYGCNKLIDLNSLKEYYVVNDEFIIEIHVTIRKTTGVHKQILRSFDDKDYSDVALLVNDKKFYVSKLFLASQSNYFKALFLGNFDESKKSEVILRGVDENNMHQFLEALYGEPAVDDITVEGVLHLADMYGTRLVTLRCESFLMKDSKKTLENKLILSGKYNMEELKQQCFDKITTIEHVRSVLHGRHDMHQSILAVLLEKSLSLK